jgi:hypothetical protein
MRTVARLLLVLGPMLIIGSIAGAGARIGSMWVGALGTLGLASIIASILLFQLADRPRDRRE